VTTIIAILLGAYWFVVAWRIQRGGKASLNLPPWQSTLQESLANSRVSIIIAVRNEAERIGETVRRLLSQQSIAFEILVIDDRSTDETAQIVEQIASEDSRVRLIRIQTLADGWLGKCHACWTGAQQATGDWLLFTDGDAHMTPQLVARAVAKAELDRADHLALFPDVLAEQFWTRVALVGQAQLFTLYTAPDNINSDRSRQWIGVGAFNLIRRNAYLSVGGHQTLKMEVVEDMKLGYLVHKHGLRQRAYSGLGDLEVDWAQSIAEIFAATEKNWFAAVHYNLPIALGICVFVPGTWLAALLAPLYAGSIGWFAVAGLLSLTIPGLTLARRFGWPWYIAPFSSVGWLVFALAGVNSVGRTLRQGGIRWRDRFYPLDRLRAGVVR
jgi:hypothetical protein